MKTTFRTMLGLGLVALIAGPAAAQGRGFGRMGGSYAGLLANASVQQELKLQDKELEKAKELAEKMAEKARENREALQGLEGEEQQKKRQELTRELNEATTKALGEFLKPEQIARLKQISYQQRGATAFNDPEVASKLGLTDAQKTDVREIVAGAREKMPTRDDFQNDREAAMKKMQEVNKEMLAQAESKLNDEQRKTWKEMLGAPFEIKYEPRNN